MGEDKAGLILGSRTLLARVVNTLRETVDEIVVVGRPGQALPSLPDSDEIQRVDDDPDRAGGGPLVGLLAGLEALRERGIERAYLGCVDAPMLSRVHVDWMLARLEVDHAAAIPDHEGQTHPLAGAVRVDEALRATQDLLAEDRRSAHALYERLHAVHVHELPDENVLLPCNTPEEWAAIERALAE
jgi:molybdopterin-guanine dinucleotide biosynthesis protein A